MFKLKQIDGNRVTRGNVFNGVLKRKDRYIVAAIW